MAKKVYINRGHSNSDPGAVKYITERTYVVAVGDYMEEYLKNNYIVEIKSSKGTVGDLATICKDANNWKADLFVSIHCNAGGGVGYEAWVYSSKNKALGQTFEKQIKALGQTSRGVKYATDLKVLNMTDMPAVLNELLFVDSKTDYNN